MQNFNNAASVQGQNGPSETGRAMRQCMGSQRVKPTESGGPLGYNAGKQIKGRKRHALVDANGRELALFPHPGLQRCRPDPAGLKAALGGQALLRLDRSQPPASGGGRSDNRARNGSRLSHCRHGSRQTDRTAIMNQFRHGLLPPRVAALRRSHEQPPQNSLGDSWIVSHRVV